MGRMGGGEDEKIAEGELLPYISSACVRAVFITTMIEHFERFWKHKTKLNHYVVAALNIKTRIKI